MPLFNSTKQHHSHVSRNFPASGTKGVFIAFYKSPCQITSLTQPVSQKHLMPIASYAHTKARHFCGIHFNLPGVVNLPVAVLAQAS